MNFPSPDQITAYAAALLTLATAITTLVLTIRNAVKTNEIHAMVKTDATPEAVASTAKPPASARLPFDRETK